ncbi:galactokinase [Bryobacterales bacterium F-183]|nr:galactokinase [Bryobacterales bacterium F-183]
MAGQATELIEKFRWKYPKSGTPRVVRAPGRINLIGDHTDYNEGFVLPMAIELACWIASAENDLGILRIHSEDLQKYIEMPIALLAEAAPRDDWSDYPIGVAQELQAAGVEFPGMDLFIDSTLPMGVGLSSSAALECAVALSLLGNQRMERVDIAKICQRAENYFAGTPCGIMDQFAIMHGREGGAIRLDCRSLEFEAVPLMRSAAVVAVNSMVKRELSASGYSDRRKECEAAIDLIAEKHPEVQSLRDVTPEMVQEIEDAGPLYGRVHHVVSENMRVAAFVQAARQNNPTAMGKYMVQSHRSLRDDYEVSCPEVDFLVETAMELAGVYGARMTGGGFGGCTVNLINRESLPEFRRRIKAFYQYRYGIDPQVFLCEPAAGAGQFG